MSTAAQKPNIKWQRNLSKDNAQYGQTWSHIGKVPLCDFYLNVYGNKGHWNWTVRHYPTSANLIVGAKSRKTLTEAKRDAAKFAFVQLLVKMDPNLFRRIKRNANYTICGIESLDTLLYGRRVPRLDEI